MQTVAPLSVARNPNSHTEEEVLAGLRGATGARRFSFRYELYDANGNAVEELSNVLGCTVEQNWLADIKRKAKFRLIETGGIDFLSDRIKPHVRLHLPPYGADDFVEWPQGVFLLTSPQRSHGENRVTRDVEAYDQLQVYSDDLLEDRYTVAAAANVVSSVSTLLGSVPAMVTPSTKTLPTAKEWPPGTSKLRIINDLLGTINYESLSFDEEGSAVVRPYVAPSDRGEEYVYASDHNGLIVPEVDQELDLFSVPNKWVLTVSDPDRAELISTYTNNDPGSPTSTVRRARTITDFRTEQDAVDQATLDAKVARLAFEASQVYEVIDFTTAMMPVHSGNDVYRITYDALAINGKFAEHTWAMELRTGVPMKHSARRVVTV